MCLMVNILMVNILERYYNSQQHFAREIGEEDHVHPSSIPVHRILLFSRFLLLSSPAKMAAPGSKLTDKWFLYQKEGVVGGGGVLEHTAAYSYIIY